MGWQVASSSLNLLAFQKEGGLVKQHCLYSLLQTLGWEGGSVGWTQYRRDTVQLTILVPMLQSESDITDGHGQNTGHTQGLACSVLSSNG